MVCGSFLASPQPGPLAGLRFSLFGLALFLSAGSGAQAHDFWVEPTSFHPAAGERVALGLWSGDSFRGSPVPRSAARTARFAVLGAAGESVVQGVEGVHPAGFFTPPEPGPYWVVFESHPRSLTLAADRFESYLLEEGLERIVELRRERAESGAAGREAYRRCAKSLIEAGGPVEGPGVANAGCSLELILESSPRSAAAAGEVAVRLLFRGEPLSGARVVVIRRGEPIPVLSARSDAAGRASFPLAAADVWLVKAVHMEAAPETDSGIDWQSWWASLTVRLPAAEPRPAP